MNYGVLEYKHTGYMGTGIHEFMGTGNTGIRGN